MLHLRSDAKAEARALVLEHHYSHTWPIKVITAITWHTDGGLFGDRGPAVAACVFGCTASPWTEQVLELTRLVRIDELEAPLSSLISAACLELRRRYQRLAINELAVSYADPQHGHHGGVYQAASWRYNGLSAPGSRIWFRGENLHSRSVSDMYGTCSIRRLKEIDPDARRLDGVSKHLYWRAINRRGKAKAKRLGLKSLPYPKPGEKPER